MGTESTFAEEFKELKSVVIRFAGDSGDGMQTIGERFTDSSAAFGNDLATFPDFPAEIRAPAGTIPGVSAFQIQIGSTEILTAGDSPDTLIAMNPAALKVHLRDLEKEGLLIVNSAAFTPENLKMAGYESNPLKDPELMAKYEVIQIDINHFTKESLNETELSAKDKLRCKNFFALGYIYWIYSRPIDTTVEFIRSKWSRRSPILAEANIKVLKSGYYFGETTETSRNRYMVAKAEVETGLYRKISGNEALVLGLIAGAKKADRKLFYSGYPITPASSILEMLSSYKHFGVKTLQAEDEIAAIGAAIGASFVGSLGVTGTSGPGMCLKAEFIGLATSTELPLVILNIQRGGPSTGLPTKTEQSDLLQAVYGRHSDATIPVIAANSASNCFETAIEAIRIALTYSTPVIVLSDLYIANGAEPWKIPSVESIPEIKVAFAKEGEPYKTFARNEETLARTLAIPGQKGLEHRIGGLEKDEAGSVSYDPENHEEMTQIRNDKIARIANSIPPTKLIGEDSGKVLVVGWGGTYGSITAAVSAMQAEGFSVSSAHLTHLHPLPKDLKEIMGRFEKVMIPELNMGQLNVLIRSQLLVETIPFNKVQGQPFKVKELTQKIHELLQD
ncbi:MAG: 2-oxoacid:acceptor oxidoreductase subunit alpha [Verrucomicrobia bacterium]|nr:2-oxoacid:acceptor oxidoreductase subunit alpha [Verrucomicrobiota bacterium]MDA1067523.1 2-oxoacid:acceptor oxidoreductase subunit alpha [Verrucomicrobiota bacterium]